MSQDNVELIKRLQPSDVDLVELFVEGDPQVAAHFGDDDADRFASDLEVSFVSREKFQLDYRGLEGFIAGWRDWLAPWSSYRIRAEEFIDAGDDVVVLIHVQSHTARDDVVMEHHPAVVWTIRQGRIVRIGMYLERSDALEVAGVPEHDVGSQAR